MEDLHAMSIRELRARARTLGIVGRAHMRKAELVTAITQRQEPAPELESGPPSEPVTAPVIEVLPTLTASVPASSRAPSRRRPPVQIAESGTRRHPHADEPPLLAPLELGDPPETYGVDLVSVLPHGPRSAAVLWSLAPATQAALASGRAEVRVVGSDGTTRARPLDTPEGMWRLVDLPPGRSWHGEIWAGRRLVLSGPAVRLPPEGQAEVATPRVVALDASSPTDLWPADLREVATPAEARPLPAWATPAAAPAAVPASSRASRG